MIRALSATITFWTNINFKFSGGFCLFQAFECIFAWAINKEISLRSLTIFLHLSWTNLSSCYTRALLYAAIYSIRANSYNKASRVFIFFSSLTVKKKQLKNGDVLPKRDFTCVPQWDNIYISSSLLKFCTPKVGFGRFCQQLSRKIKSSMP